MKKPRKKGLKDWWRTEDDDQGKQMMVKKKSGEESQHENYNEYKSDEDETLMLLNAACWILVY